MTIYVGKNIKFLRVKNDITQDKIGDLIGKSGKTVSSYESGQAEPNISALAVLSKIFGVTTDSLLFSDIENSDLSENVGILNEPPPQYKVGKEEKPETMTLDEIEVLKKTVELLQIRMHSYEKEMELMRQELRKKK